MNANPESLVTLSQLRTNVGGRTRRSLDALKMQCVRWMSLTRRSGLWRAYRHTVGSRSHQAFHTQTSTHPRTCARAHTRPRPRAPFPWTAARGRAAGRSFEIEQIWNLLSGGFVSSLLKSLDDCNPEESTLIRLDLHKGMEMKVLLPFTSTGSFHTETLHSSLLWTMQVSTCPGEPGHLISVFRGVIHLFCREIY